MPALHLADLDRGRVVAIPAAAEDEAILAAVHQGAVERAAALLFDRYAEHVTRVLVRILGSMDEVEDLRQEALLRTLDRLHKVRSADVLRGYVTGVTTFVARECLRRRRRIQSRPRSRCACPSRRITARVSSRLRRLRS